MVAQQKSWIQTYGSELPFTVVSYNLADSTCTLTAGEKAQRQRRLYNHIIESKADIVCMQDVNDWLFWRDSLLEKKFGCCWKKRASTSKYGCCIFCNVNRFNFIERVFMNDGKDCEPYVRQILVLEDKGSTKHCDTEKRTLLVCNIQTDPDTINGATILEQMDDVFRNINQIVRRAEPATSWSSHTSLCRHQNARKPLSGVLVCGNMNFTSSSEIGRFMRTGNLETNGLDTTLLTGVKELSHYPSKELSLAETGVQDLYNGGPVEPSSPPQSHTTSPSTPVLGHQEGEESPFLPQVKTNKMCDDSHALSLPNNSNFPHPHRLHGHKTYSHCLEGLCPIYDCNLIEQLQNNVKLQSQTTLGFPLLDNIWYNAECFVVSELGKLQFPFEEYFEPCNPFLIASFKYHDIPYNAASQGYGHHPMNGHAMNGRCTRPTHPDIEKHRTEFKKLFTNLIVEAFAADRPSDVKKSDRESAVSQMVRLKDQLELQLQSCEEILDLHLDGELTLSIQRFGSTIFGLDSSNSDVDLVIEVLIGGKRTLFLPNDSHTNDFTSLANESSAPLNKLPVIILKRLAQTLESNNDIKVVQTIFAASVPLIKASVEYGHGPITLDISVLTEDKTLKAADCIKTVLGWHDAVAPFLFAVKLWKQYMTVGKAYTGTMNSYGWINMAIWSLRHMYKTDILPEKTPSELFEEFLDCMTKNCFHNLAIAMKVSDGSIVPNSEHPIHKSNRLWVLLDPVDNKSNIIKTLQERGIQEIQMAITLTQNTLKELPTLLYQKQSRLPRTLGELFANPK